MDYLFSTMNALSGSVLILLINANHDLYVSLNLSLKLGLWVGAIGLLAQAGRTFSNATLGYFPFDGFPIWVLKDIGYWLLIGGLLITWQSARKKQ